MSISTIRPGRINQEYSRRATHHGPGPWNENARPCAADRESAKRPRRRFASGPPRRYRRECHRRSPTQETSSSHRAPRREGSRRPVIAISRTRRKSIRDGGIELAFKKTIGRKKLEQRPSDPKDPDRGNSYPVQARGGMANLVPSPSGRGVRVRGRSEFERHAHMKPPDAIPSTSRSSANDHRERGANVHNNRSPAPRGIIARIFFDDLLDRHALGLSIEVRHNAVTQTGARRLLRCLRWSREAGFA